MAAQFELKKAKNGQFFFNLRAGNGETVLSSEMYTSKAGAENGIASVQNNADNDKRYEQKKSKNGKQAPAPKPRQLTLTATDPQAETVSTTTKVVITPKPTVPKSLSAA